MLSVLPMLNQKKYQKGFSLVELIVMLTIIALFSTLLLYNARSSKTGTTARHQISALIMADIRRAQSLALSGLQYQGQLVCGYGVHRVDAGSYLIYAGVPEGGGPTCIAANRNYQPGTDFVFETVRVDNTDLAVRGPIGGSFFDLFFESPDPRVYLNNVYDLNGAADIYVVNQGQVCGGTNCTIVTVYGSGRVDVVN